MSATVLVIGASRGIGHALALSYKASGARVIATARSAEAVKALSAEGLEAHRLEATSPDDWLLLSAKLADETLDVVLHVAGVSGGRKNAIEAPTREDFDEVMRANVWAAMQMYPVVGPLLEANKGKLAVVSSLMGSIGERDSSSSWLYRASKAAINSTLKDASLVLGPKGVVCVTLHPGWVKADLGGPNAHLTIEQSVSGLRRVVDGLKPADNGSFINFDGRPIAW
ncbi:SDR family oxidoreductase [soil metagenome]